MKTRASLRQRIVQTGAGPRLRLPASGRRLLAAAAALAAALVATGCVTQATAYPIETFTEMHYSQAYRSQETPRLSGVAGAVVFTESGVDNPLTVLPASERRGYAAASGAELYRVNCAVCHGSAGLGDGPAVPYITSLGSVWAADNGAPYAAPPNLQTSSFDEIGMFGIITGGIALMPRFGPLLSEEDRWDVVRYIFDEQAGLRR